MSEDEVAVLNDVACPRCGCWLKKNFECGCGAVHSDYCVNCGRFTTLPPYQTLELCEGFGQARCEKGPVMHNHPPEERAERIKAYFEKVKKERGT